MFTKKAFLALGILLFVTFNGYSGGKGDMPKSATEAKAVNVLLYSATPEMTDWLNGFITRFNATNSDIVLEQEVQMNAATLQVKYAAGEDPDILLGNAILTQQYADMGKYENLTPHKKWLDRVDQKLLHSITDIKTGLIYRLPLCKSNGGFLYNTKIFNELGLKEALTWDEFMNNLRAIKRAKPNVTPWYIWGGNYGHQAYFFVFGDRQIDIGSLEAQRAISLNQSNVLKFNEDGSFVEVWAQRLLEVQKEGLIDNEDAITGTDATAYEAFATGKAGVLLTGTWFIGGLVKQFPEVKDFMSIAPLPSIINGRKPFTTGSTDSSLAISTASKHKDQVYRVFDELLKVENLKTFSESRGAPSSFEGVNSDWSVLAPKVRENQSKYPAIVHPMLPSRFGMNDISKLAQELLVGAYTPKQFAAEFTRRWNAAF